MEFFATLFIAIGLAMDAFAVSLGIGTTPQSRDNRARFRLAFHFGFFQAMMTFLGWLAGTTVASLISSVDHWIAFGLLAYVGVNLLRSGFNPEMESYKSDPSRGSTLTVLCIATSLDAMAVGLSMALLGTDIIVPALIIGIVAFILSGFGLLVGNQLGNKFGKRMEIVGGLILVSIGLRVLYTHLIT
jgi:manganese efflux pump family protein